MPQNFLACDREQELLLPPSLREWLPDDHLAWFVVAAVEKMDLVLLLQAALCLAQPGRARFRNRPSFGGATLIQATLRIAQPAAPPLHRRQLRRQLIAAPVAKALVL